MEGTASVRGAVATAWSRLVGAWAKVVPRRRDRPSGWVGTARSTRLRVVGVIAALFLTAGILSTLALQEVLALGLQSRVEGDLEQEVLEIDRLISDGRDPSTGERFESLRSLFDLYFERNVVGNEEATLAYVDGQLYRSATARFPLDNIPSPALDAWRQYAAALSGDEPNTGTYGSRLGEGRYRAVHVRYGDEMGAFVVTILPAAQLSEIDALQRYGLLTTVGTVLVVLVFVWLAVGRVLAPVRSLTETARSISDSDLTRRIPVRGPDEAIEMATSFNGMLDRLEAAVRSQREFVDDASHELREPITICRTSLELLDDDPMDREATITLVLDELDRMARIVGDLQVLAEAETPDFLEPELIDVASFTHELATKVRSLAPRVWTVDEEGEGKLLADRHRLTEAVVNLAHNAVNHTTPDQVVAIGTSVADGRLRIWVRDNGPGIPAGDRQRIFERFVRGRGRRDGYPGSGLGLAIVRAVAEAHGGTVDLQTRLGRGATFTITIPVVEPGEVLREPDPDR